MKVSSFFVTSLSEATISSFSLAANSYSPNVLSIAKGGI